MLMQAHNNLTWPIMLNSQLASATTRESTLAPCPSMRTCARTDTQKCACRMGLKGLLCAATHCGQAKKKALRSLASQAGGRSMKQ